MSDKALLLSTWKSFTKASGGQDAYKEAALLKALAALEKAERSGPEVQLEALDELEKQAEALGRLHKADKPLAAYVADVAKAVARERKAQEAARDKAAESAGDDEEESPALLTARMVPLLRQLQKGEVTMQALIATTGKETAVLVSRRSVPSSRGKLLKDYLGVSGSIRLLKAECLFEAKAITFVVETPAGGLAKKLKAALLEQTGLRLKVRVRGADGNDVDEEGEEGEGNESAAGAGAGAGAAQPAAQPAAAGTGEGNAAAVASFEQALDAWRSARGAAVGTLKGLAARVAALKDPDSAKAVMEVSAVVKQLSAEPRTAQQVADLIRYVNEDDVVFDVCDIETDIRTPMIGALGELQRALAGAG